MAIEGLSDRLMESRLSLCRSLSQHLASPVEAMAIWGLVSAFLLPTGQGLALSRPSDGFRVMGRRKLALP